MKHILVDVDFSSLFQDGLDNPYAKRCLYDSGIIEWIMRDLTSEKPGSVAVPKIPSKSLCGIQSFSFRSRVHIPNFAEMNPPTRRRVPAAVEEEGRVTEKSVEAQKDAGLVTFLAETVIAFVFWSSLAEGVPALWYIPMNLMAISGAELFLTFYMAPAFLTIRPIRELSWNAPLVNLTTIISLVSLYMPTVLTYGTGLLIGSCAHFIFVVGQFLHPSPAARERRLLTLFCGLISFICVRFGLSSVSPLFLYTNVNIFTIILMVVASFILHINRPAPVKAAAPVKSFSALSTDIGAGLGFGALVFLTIMFLSEHGVLARWNNADPFPIGLGMIATVVSGFFIARHPFTRYVPSHFYDYRLS